MTAPIDRDRQIKLMREAQKRMSDRAQAWAKVPVIREALKRVPASQRDEEYHRTVVKVARCG